MFLGHQLHWMLATAQTDASLERQANPVVVPLPERKEYVKDPQEPVAAAMYVVDVTLTARRPDNGGQRSKQIAANQVFTERLAGATYAVQTAQVTTPTDEDLATSPRDREGFAYCSAPRRPPFPTWVTPKRPNCPARLTTRP
jgi:hypothetical protein